MNDMKRKPWLALIFAFIAIYFIWGTTYLAIAYALKGLQPFIISAFRYLIAGLILSCWVWLKKQPWPKGKDRRVLIISGILMLSGGSGLVVVGEQYISSGFAAVIVATEPLFFVLFDHRRWRAYFSNRWIIAGLVIGFAGIALFAYFAPAGSRAIDRNTSLGIIITLLSAMTWVAGGLYANHNLSTKTSNTVNSAVQLLAAGVFSAIVAGCTREWSALLVNTIPVSAWAGLVYLIVMGSLVAYSSFNWLITVQPPAIVSTHTYVNPIVAILIGWLLAREPIAHLQIIALVIVLTGVVLTQLNKQKLLEAKG
jgi:drug/metabolite transporter (DMT)-like permease